MKSNIRICIIYIAFISSNLVYGESYHDTVNKHCEKCNPKIMLEIEDNIYNLSYTKIYCFLKCFNDSLINNAELSEMGNEVLFLLLIKQPQLTVNVLKNELDISIESIKFELQNPVNDSIEILSAYNTIKKVKNHKRVKREILKSLKIAVQKNDKK